MPYGQGFGSFLGAAVQPDKDTYTAPTVWVPFKGETLKPKIPRKESASIYGTRTVKQQIEGIKEIDGGFSIELLINVVGQFLAWWNGLSDDDTVTTVPPNSPDSTLYKHTLIVGANAPDVVPLPYLSLVKVPDIDESMKVTGYMLDKFNLNLGNDPSAPVEITFDGMGLTFASVTNPVDPAPVLETPCVAWQAQISIGGSANTLLEGLTITGDNKLAKKMGYSNTQSYSRVHPNAQRSISGSITLGYENQDQFDRLIAGTSFELIITVNGPYTNSPALRITLPTCYYTEATGSINGPARITEALPFVVADETGVDMQIEVWSTTQDFFSGAVTRPTVSSTSPADTDTGVAVGANVVFTLSQPLAASSVNGGTAYLEKTSDGTLVACTVTLVNNGSSTTVTLNPASNLSASTAYTAHLSGVRNLSGAMLATPKVVNFETA